MTASIAESDDLNAISHVSNSVSSFVPEKVSFEYKTTILDSKKQALKTAKAATSTSAFVFKKQEKSNKKRKAQMSAAASDNEDFQLNSSFYIQKAIDNLNIAAAKELNAKTQQKIKKIAANAQQILLNESELNSDSECESQQIQQQMQLLKSDMNEKFNQIHSMFADLKSANKTAVKITVISTDNKSVANSAVNSAVNSVNNATNAAKSKTATKSYAQVVVSNSQEQN